MTYLQEAQHRRRGLILAVAISAVVWALLAFAAFARADEVNNDPPLQLRKAGEICHALWWFPMLQQSICGYTTLELGYRFICRAGDGEWDFTPGQMPKCVGYKRPKPTPTEGS